MIVLKKYKRPPNDKIKKLIKKYTIKNLLKHIFL